MKEIEWDVIGPASPARRIDANTERAARTFLKRLDGRYAVVDALLSGSRARETFIVAIRAMFEALKN